MIRFTLRTLAVATGLLAGVGTTFAVDPAQNLGRYKPSDDKKAVAPATTADDDTEQIRHRGWYGYSNYYRPYYGGFGRSYYGGGFSYGYSSFYAPRYYAPTYFYTPRYYAPPVYYYATPSYYGGFCGISDTVGAVTLSLSLKASPTVREAARALPSPIEPGTFRYDGGPNQVVPQPVPDGKPMPKADPVPPADDTIKVSLKPTTATKPKYKAYGEK